MLKRQLRRLLIAATFLGALVALFYAEENWRGKRAWETYKREREANGGSFEWSSVVPPPVPDEQNFAATPLFAELFPKPPKHPRLEAVRSRVWTNAFGNWHEGRVENLDAWRTCFTNADLLAALSKYDPVLHEVTEASHRPCGRFPIRFQDNESPLLPHLNPLRNLTTIFRLRALAELPAGQADAALGDVQTCLRLADTIRDEPLLMSFLVRAAMLDIATQPVWEALAEHRWNDNQLAALQTEFAKIDILGHFGHALQSEGISACHTILWLQGHRNLVFDLGGRSWEKVPKGWFYRNALSAHRYYAEKLASAVQPQTQRVSPQRVRQVMEIPEPLHVTPYNTLALQLTAPIGGAFRRAALSQTSAQQAAVACAVERYRLAHRQLPDTLDALVTEFLANVPHDVIDGQRLRYRRVGTDQFVLYSIGWNELDDGGQIAWRSGIPQEQDLNKGDWVWFSQPQPQPSASERK